MSAMFLRIRRRRFQRLCKKRLIRRLKTCRFHFGVWTQKQRSRSCGTGCDGSGRRTGTLVRMQRRHNHKVSEPCNRGCFKDLSALDRPYSIHHFRMNEKKEVPRKSGGFSGFMPRCHGEIILQILFSAAFVWIQWPFSQPNLTVKL